MMEQRGQESSVDRRSEVVELVRRVAMEMQQAGLPPAIMRIGVEEQSGRVYVDVVDSATLVRLGRAYSDADCADILSASRLLLQAASSGPEGAYSLTA